VVAVLTHEDSVGEVARAAVDLAGSLGARVRFVHVLPAGRALEPAAEVGSAAFAAVLLALRQGHPQGATFESLCEPAGRTLVVRSHKAVALVVAEDRLNGGPDGDAVATFCGRHARCTVHVVPRGG
jgi:hypothetical protein